jgi:hypothetical protein
VAGARSDRLIPNETAPRSNEASGMILRGASFACDGATDCSSSASEPARAGRRGELAAGLSEGAPRRTHRLVRIPCALQANGYASALKGISDKHTSILFFTNPLTQSATCFCSLEGPTMIRFIGNVSPEPSNSAGILDLMSNAIVPELLKHRIGNDPYFTLLKKRSTLQTRSGLQEQCKMFAYV